MKQLNLEKIKATFERVPDQFEGMVAQIGFPSGKNYKAVCLDFDIIEESKTREEVEKQIKEAIVGYIKNVCKRKFWRT